MEIVMKVGGRGKKERKKKKKTGELMLSPHVGKERKGKERNGWVGNGR